MGLLDKKGVDTQEAIKLYDQAEGMAKRSAEAHGKKVYGAEQIADELDKLLRPILMRENLLDAKEYTRIQQLIYDWDSEVDTGKCAAVQMNLINLLPVIKQQQQQQIKTTVSEYRLHLEGKMKGEGCFTFSEDGSITANEALTTKQQKLMTRYVAMRDLDESIKGKTTLDEKDIETARDALRTCLDNKPDWSERPFLQKLTDVLSLGFKALFRAFNSREAGMEKDLEQLVSKRRPNP